MTVSPSTGVSKPPADSVSPTSGVGSGGVSDLGGVVAYTFDGVNMHATIPDWAPLGLPFTVSAQAVPLTIDASNRFVWHSDANNLHQAKIGSSGNYDFAIPNAGGTSDFPSAGAATVGVRVALTAASTADQTVVSAVTETTVSNTPRVDGWDIGFIAVRDNLSQFFHGPIWNLFLTDNSPIQATTYNKGNASLTGAIPSIAFTTGNVAFDYIHQSANHTILTGSVALLTSVSGVLTAGANVTSIIVDSVAYAGATLIAGQHYRVSFSVSAGTLTTIGALPASSAMQNLVIDEGSDQFTFPMDEGSGTVITNTDPITGPRDGNGTWTATDWTAIADNSRFYPMNDGPQNGGTLADLRGGQDGTIVNYDADNWGIVVL